MAFKKIERVELDQVRRLRIDIAKGIILKITFINRLKFFFNLNCEFSYLEINGGVVSGWLEFYAKEE